MVIDPYVDLSSMGRENLEQLAREVAQGKAVCLVCESTGAAFGLEDTARKFHTGEEPPYRYKATCVVWQPDVRVMVDLSHCEPSCDYHVSFHPWTGESPAPNGQPWREILVTREVLWRP